MAIRSDAVGSPTLRDHRSLRLPIASLMSPVDSLLAGRPAGDAICHGMIGSLRRGRLPGVRSIRWRIVRPTKNDTFARSSVAKGARSCRLSVRGQSTGGRSPVRLNRRSWLAGTSQIGALGKLRGRIPLGTIGGMPPLAPLADRSPHRKPEQRRVPEHGIRRSQMENQPAVPGNG